MHVFLTASLDGMVKIWDRRSYTPVAQMSLGTRAPFHSVAANKGLIVAGTNEDIVLWDIHHLSKPIGHFTECHSDDVTQIRFNPYDSNQFISSSMDYVLNMFNLSQTTQKRIKEDEVVEGGYSCLQPMTNCGYVSSQVIWAQTTLNTVEFIRTMDAICFLRIDKVSLALLNIAVSA